MVGTIYTLNIFRRAQKGLSNLDEGSYIRVRDAIRALARDHRPVGSKRLTGRPGWRVRVGFYRVIYEVDDVNHVITIMHVGHRRDVYR